MNGSIVLRAALGALAGFGVGAAGMALVLPWLTGGAERPQAALVTPAARQEATAPSLASAVAPAFDTVRVEPDGSGLVAGRASPGTRVAILAGDVVATEATADNEGRFVAFLDLPPSDQPVALSLRDASGMMSDETVFLSPIQDRPLAPVLRLSDSTTLEPEQEVPPEAMAEPPGEAASGWASEATALAPAEPLARPAEEMDGATPVEQAEPALAESPLGSSLAEPDGGPAGPAVASDAVAPAPETSDGLDVASEQPILREAGAVVVREEESTVAAALDAADGVDDEAPALAVVAGAEQDNPSTEDTGPNVEVATDEAGPALARPVSDPGAAEADASAAAAERHEGNEATRIATADVGRAVVVPGPTSGPDETLPSAELGPLADATASAMPEGGLPGSGRVGSDEAVDLVAVDDLLESATDASTQATEEFLAPAVEGGETPRTDQVAEVPPASVLPPVLAPAPEGTAVPATVDTGPIPVAPVRAEEVASVAMPPARTWAADPEEAPRASPVPRVVEAAPEAPAEPVAGEGGQSAVLVSDARGVRVMQPALPPGADPELAASVALDAIAYDGNGEVILSGRGRVGEAVQLYLNNQLVAETLVQSDGIWSTPLTGAEPGVYTLRLDQLDPLGRVISRIEMPFQREERDDLAALMAKAQEEGQSIVTRVVQPGNTLWAIARERYGEPLMYVRVFEANRDRIRNPNLIYPGQVFVLPATQGR